MQLTLLHWPLNARLVRLQIQGERRICIPQCPYDKQNTDENRELRREYKQSHERAPLNEVNEQSEFSNSSESDEDQSLNWSHHITYSKITKVRNMSYLKLVHVLEKQN